ncbi:MAG: hypothetical protein INR71_14795 [Terriglobus roseus]|nr:hypothetical protein [Terriglobus roseus]
MRTTLTIDDDVEALLRQRLRATGEPFKQAVNKYLRLGMQAEAKAPKAKAFKVKPFANGLPSHWDYTKASELAEKLDDPAFR